MKGELRIKPGFEAGSLYCGECILKGGIYVSCKAHKRYYYGDYVQVELESDKIDWIRCQQCLDAEINPTHLKE